MHKPMEKSARSALTLEKHIKIANYERVGHVLSLMKPEARKRIRFFSKAAY